MIGLGRLKFAQRTCAHRAHLLRGHDRRRRTRGAFEERELVVDVRGIPRDLRALRQFGDANADAVEHILQGEARFTHDLAERLRIGTIGPLRRLSDGARLRIQCDQHALTGVHDRKTRRERLAFASEWPLIGEVEHHDVRIALQGSERSRDVGDANGVQRNIGVALHDGAWRNQEILALHLQAIAGNIDRSDSALPGCLHFLQEFLECASHRIGVEIARAGDVEARGAQSFGDEAGVIGGGRQWRAFIVVVADHESITRLLLLLRSGASVDCGHQAERRKPGKKPSIENLHKTSSMHAPLLTRAA